MAVTVDSYTEEIKLMRNLHGQLVFDESSFLKKVGRKDDTLNKQAAQSYQSLWQDQNDLKDNESYVDGRREKAQSMTNSFYDLVTDFYEYGKLYRMQDEHKQTYIIHILTCSFDL